MAKLHGFASEISITFFAAAKGWRPGEEFVANSVKFRDLRTNDVVRNPQGVKPYGYPIALTNKTQQNMLCANEARSSSRTSSWRRRELGGPIMNRWNITLPTAIDRKFVGHTERTSWGRIQYRILPSRTTRQTQ